MGYRWYKGRFLSDFEYADLLKQESNQFWFSVGFLIPTALLGFIGYQYSTAAMWVGIVIGAILGIVLNRLILIVSIIAVVVMVIIAFFKVKSESNENQSAQSTSVYFHVINPKGANLRTHPSLKAEKVVTLSLGSELLYLNDSIYSDNFKWYKVSSNGAMGWISSGLVNSH